MKIILGLLAFACSLLCYGLGITIIGAIIAAVVAKFTTGIVTYTAGAAVVFAVKCAAGWLCSLFGMIVFSISAADS